MQRRRVSPALGSVLPCGVALGRPARTAFVPLLLVVVAVVVVPACRDDCDRPLTLIEARTTLAERMRALRMSDLVTLCDCRLCGDYNIVSCERNVETYDAETGLLLSHHNASTFCELGDRPDPDSYECWEPRPCSNFSFGVLDGLYYNELRARERRPSARIPETLLSKDP